MESNLLGTASLLIAILAVRDGEPGGRLLYIDPHLGGSRFQLFGALAYTDERRDVWDADEEIGSYRQRRPPAARSRSATASRGGPRPRAGLRLTDFSFSEPEGAPRRPRTPASAPSC